MKEIDLINAGAGSGKTHRLTELVSEKLRDGISPEGLMAATFTNKAAAELSERIRFQLLKDGKAGEARRVGDGFVGTVNSICARLLQEYALEAGLSPALEVLPEEDGERLFKIAINQVIEAHAPALEPAAKRLNRVGGGAEYQRLDDWRDDVRAVVDLARANRLQGDALLACAERSWDSLAELLGDAGPDTTGQLDAAVDAAVPALSAIPEPKQKTAKTLDDLKAFQRLRRRDDAPWSEWARLAKCGANKDGEGLLEKVNLIAGDVLKHPRFQADLRDMIFGVFACAAEALQAYEEFKRNQGLMDFVDQEALVLAMAGDNAAFRASMGDRLEQLMVDEFQDTSPIQLALFLRLNELAGQSVWVGDPKQSIYAFRGADPQLMEEVAKRLTSIQTLDESWRSRERLVDFTNAVFSEVFREMGPENVRLKIPEARREAARGGWLESWYLLAKNKLEEAPALANGVRDLLANRPDLKPGDIAVLCATNKQCADVARAMEALGIRASAGQGSLKETRECRLALAALRYLNDARDTAALAEIVHLSPGHAYHGRWLETAIRERAGAAAVWAKDPLIASLDEARRGLEYRTPLEALELAIDRAEVMNTIKSWPNTPAGVDNLDALRGACGEYLAQCRARRAAGSVAGFMNYLNEADPARAQGAGEHAVQVQTYHSAKGLEWPVVILSGLDRGLKGGAFGISMAPAPKFDPADPLANRTIRFWPWPFGRQKSLPALDPKLADRPEELQAQQWEREEACRLLYVGMTRARDGMVLAVYKKQSAKSATPQTAWLNLLTDEAGEPLIKLPAEAGEQEFKIKAAAIPVTVREFTAESTGETTTAAERGVYLAPPATNARDYPPAALTASELKPEGSADLHIEIRSETRLGERLEVKGQPDVSALGSAVHGFLAADHADLSVERRCEMAAELLARWSVEGSFDPADMLIAANRLQSFIENTYPGAKISREWPVSFDNADRRLMQGWVDTLLELPEGYIIIDHKCYPGADPLEEAKKHAPQLALYAQAVRKATGKEVLETLVHMPVVGRVFGLEAVGLETV